MTLIEVESLGLGRFMSNEMLLDLIDCYPKSLITFALSFDDVFLAVPVFELLEKSCDSVTLLSFSDSTLFYGVKV